MRLHVIHETLVFQKVCAALVTLVLSAGVDEDVVSQHQVNAPELLSTLVACVQSFPGVSAHVSLEVILSTEALLTLLAHVTFLRVMDRAMLCQLVWSSEPLGTLLAGVSSLVRMSDHV